MSTQLKLRRGTTAQHSTFTGASGEVTVDTTKKTLVVHDGVTAGGTPLQKEVFVNVKDYGAVGDGVTNDTTAIQNAIAAGTQIYFPKGKYKCNLALNGLTGKRLFGNVQGQYSEGAVLIPASSASPVIDVVGPTIDIVVENLLLDSKLDSTYSGAGIGLRVKANSPNFAWRCAFRHLFIRGFQDGLVIDCDINFSEVFDNDFHDIETIGCSRYSFKTRGVYNTFRKMFATQCSDYAFYNDGSNCTFDSVVGDGRMAFYGGGQQVTNAVIEAIYGVGAGVTFPAMELNGNTSVFQGIRVNGCPNSKYGIGVSVYGLGQMVSDVVIEGTSYPSEPIRLNNSSSGTLINATAPTSGTTKITSVASSATLAAWTFAGDVSAVYAGTRMSGMGVAFPATQIASTDPNTLDDYEEGTWTPTDQSGAGLSFTINRTATYKKVGEQVFAYFDITYPTTSNGNSSIISLPFVNSSVHDASVSIGYTTYASAFTGDVARSQAYFYPSTFGGANITNASLSGKRIIGVAIYETA